MSRVRGKHQQADTGLALAQEGFSVFIKERFSLRSGVLAKVFPLHTGFEIKKETKKV